MSTLITICINWLAAGFCFGMAAAAIIEKRAMAVPATIILGIMNAGLGVVGVMRLLQIIGFAAEATK